MSATGGARRLIVNADGFGFTYGNNRAIFDALKAGVVRSISVNANFPAVEEVARVIREFPRVSVGIHFNLAVGRPVSDPAGRDIRQLVMAFRQAARQGWQVFEPAEFVRALLTGRIRLTEIRRELEAQIGVLRGLGVCPSHWDGHNNEHLLPGYFEMAIAVARGAGIPRMRTNRHHLFAGGASPGGALLHYLRHPDRLARHLVDTHLRGAVPRRPSPRGNDPPGWERLAGGMARVARAGRVPRLSRVLPVVPGHDAGGHRARGADATRPAHSFVRLGRAAPWRAD